MTRRGRRYKNLPIKERLSNEIDNIRFGYKPKDYGAFYIIYKKGEKEFLNKIDSEPHEENIFYSLFVDSVSRVIRLFANKDIEMSNEIDKKLISRSKLAQKTLENRSMPGDKIALFILKQATEKRIDDASEKKNFGSLFSLGAPSAGLTEVTRIFKKKDIK